MADATGPDTATSTATSSDVDGGQDFSWPEVAAGLQGTVADLTDAVVALNRRVDDLGRRNRRLAEQNAGLAEAVGGLVKRCDRLESRGTVDGGGGVAQT